MAYEYEELILHDVKPLTNPGPPFRYEAMKELQEVYRKAKVLDEVKNFTTERLKEQKLTDEYDFGERLMCEEIKEIIGGRVMYMVMATDKTFFTGRCQSYFGSKMFKDVNVTTDINKALIFKDKDWVREFVKKYGGKIVKIKLQEVF